MWCSTSTSHNPILEAGGNLPTTVFSEDNIISWNVWGLNRRDKRSIVKSLIKKWKADIYRLQESTLEGDVQSCVNQIRGHRWGILVLWDSRIWKGEVVNVVNYTITCKFVSQRVERRMWWEAVISRESLLDNG